MSTALLEIHDLDIAYEARGGLPFLGRKPQAVIRDVSFTVAGGETVALVGESGSGKTTLARAIAGLLAPTRGQILFENQNITAPIEQRSKELHRQIQFVFQNPDASLNPRRRISHILGRPLEFFFGLADSAKTRRVEELLEAVHLNPSYMHRFPGQLSGGERQRVAIAQALAAEPKLILCDEIVSALDVSVQASILDLLRELQARRGIAYVFIAHDLAVVRWLAHRVLVLYRGRLMEQGAAAEVFTPPFHPYTEMLLQSVPEPEPGRSFSSYRESPFEQLNVENKIGCPFSSRCPHRVGPICDQQMPPWQTVGPAHAIYCQIPVAELAKRQGALST
ncbi:MAG: ABC transporter ATP-binding protein [Chloroflexi bacterium]|nr:ABC transporter ATP-binding protein [Chloroflexota bacterium]